MRNKFEEALPSDHGATFDATTIRGLQDNTLKGYLRQIKRSPPLEEVQQCLSQCLPDPCQAPLSGWKPKVAQAAEVLPRGGGVSDSHPPPHTLFACLVAVPCEHHACNGMRYFVAQPAEPSYGPIVGNNPRRKTQHKSTRCLSS